MPNAIVRESVADPKGGLRDANTGSRRLPLAWPIVAFVCLFHARPIAAASQTLSGVVTDPSGRPVVGARITVTAGDRSRASVSNERGEFVVDLSRSGLFTLIVEAPAYLRTERRLTARAENTRVVIVLLPAAVSEQVIVTATRTPVRLGDTAASVVALSSEAIATTAAESTDDVLRQVPGFSLFRRTGSRTANPTTQGVSLRGVGSSGASRAVVLDDGIPLNDPFGGWVSWGRVPRASIDRVEILQGGGSDLYGSGALGGVVNLVRRTTEPGQSLIETSYGAERTPDVSLFAGKRQGRWGGSIGAELFRTDGYIPVGPSERGAVDTPAGSRHGTANVTIDHGLSGNGRLFLRGSYFDESRHNGTPLQTNDTRIWQVGAGGDWQSALGSFSLHARRSDHTFHQSFSAVSTSRSSERLTGLQTVPAVALGLTGQWQKSVGGAHTIVSGIDLSQVTASNDEQRFSANTTSFVTGAGRQRTLAFFAEDLLRLSARLSATAALRLDRWSNIDGERSTRPSAEVPATTIQFLSRAETVVSPRASILYAWTDHLSLGASAYRAFRAPTLNELYRSFRVGDVVTLANENLEAERLTGGEGSLFLSCARLTTRGTLFWMEIERPVTSVTVAVTPSQITRQRQNLGLARSRGVEVVLELRAGQRWVLSGGYLFVDSRVVDSPASSDLEGRRIPQVPAYQATLQLRYADPALVTLGFQGRLVGAQFDDDQNQFRLGSFFVLDAMASRPIHGGLEAFVAVENLFDKRYEAGRTPVRTLGPPRFWRFGLRYLAPL